jgi:hypothetical protein
VTVTKRCPVCGRFRSYDADDDFCIGCGHEGLEAECTCGASFDYALAETGDITARAAAACCEAELRVRADDGVTTSSLLLGAHVSTGRRGARSAARAAALEATAMQLFTKMANRWAERDCENDECRLFHERLAETRVTATMAHDSYLINLASPDPAPRARSIASFVAELRRCDVLGLDYLVSHPGNFMDEREAGSRATPTRSARRWRR